MDINRFFSACCGGMLLACMSVGAAAQNYPAKLVRIVTANPGGGNDLAARIIYQPLSSALGQPVIVENRGGGNGEATMRAVLSQQPDGYTLLIYSSGLWVAPLVEEVSWDPVRDFAPIAMMAKAPNVLVVHPSLPVRSVKELISFARSRPEQLFYSSGQNGAGTHLSAELFNSLAKVKLTRVVYKGTGAGIIAGVSGEVQVMFPSVGSVEPFLKSSRLRPLAVTGATPSALLPNLPTMAAAGLPGYESESSYGIFAPAKTPVAIINRLNQEVVKVLANPEVKERFFKSGIEVVSSTPQEFEATIKSDIAKWGKVIKSAGIRAL
jgi:tripartite-type tricarboxylate transporter receptor subunit TctC